MTHFEKTVHFASIYKTSQEELLMTFHNAIGVLCILYKYYEFM